LEKRTYKGLYCVGCEGYKTEKDLIDGKCPDHPTRFFLIRRCFFNNFVYRQIETVDEENYFFKLSKYAKQIIHAIETDELKIVPSSRKAEIIQFLREAKDVSFSRFYFSFESSLTFL
jgi:methionyl-tRNA synthetase